jgi:hypothetical protein
VRFPRAGVAATGSGTAAESFFSELTSVETAIAFNHELGHSLKQLPELFRLMHLRIKPPVLIRAAKDDRHAVVNLTDELVGCCRQDRKRRAFIKWSRWRNAYNPTSWRFAPTNISKQLLGSSRRRGQFQT